MKKILTSLSTMMLGSMIVSDAIAMHNSSAPIVPDEGNPRIQRAATLNGTTPIVPGKGTLRIQREPAPNETAPTVPSQENPGIQERLQRDEAILVRTEEGNSARLLLHMPMLPITPMMLGIPLTIIPQLSGAEMALLQKTKEAYKIWSEGPDKHSSAELSNAETTLCNYIGTLGKVCLQNKHSELKRLELFVIPYFEGTPNRRYTILQSENLAHPLSRATAVLANFFRPPLSPQNNCLQIRSYREVLSYNTIIEILRSKDPNKILKKLSCKTCVSVIDPQALGIAYDHYIECANNVLSTLASDSLSFIATPDSATFFKKMCLHNDKVQLVEVSSGASRSPLTLPMEFFSNLPGLSSLNRLGFTSTHFPNTGLLFDYLEKREKSDMELRLILTNFLDLRGNAPEFFKRLRNAHLESLTIQGPTCKAEIAKQVILNLPKTLKNITLSIKYDVLSVDSVNEIFDILTYNPYITSISITPCEPDDCVDEYIDDDAKAELLRKSAGSVLKKIAILVALKPELEKIQLERINFLQRFFGAVREKQTIDDRLRVAIDIYDTRSTKDEIEHQITWIKSTNELERTIKDTSNLSDPDKSFQNWLRPLNEFREIVVDSAKVNLFCQEYFNFYRQYVRENYTDESKLDELKSLVPQNAQMSPPPEKKKAVELHKNTLSLSAENKKLFERFSAFFETSVNELKKLSERRYDLLQHRKTDIVEEPTTTTRSEVIQDKLDAIVEDWRRSQIGLKKLQKRYRPIVQERLINEERVICKATPSAAVKPQALCHMFTDIYLSWIDSLDPTVKTENDKMLYLYLEQINKTNQEHWNK